MKRATNTIEFRSPVLVIITLGFALGACESSNSGEIITIAGTGVAEFSGDGGPAFEASLSFPQDVAVGPDGNIYVIDWNNNRIRVLTEDGRIQTVAGSGSSGEALPGKATESDLNHPADILFDDAGRLLIAAWFSSKIVRVDLATGELEHLYGTGARDYGGEGGPAAEATFDLPAAIVYDTSGNLYVRDQNNQIIRKVDGAGMIARFAGQCIVEDLTNDACMPGTATGVCEASDKRTCLAEELPDDVCLFPCGQGFAGDGGPALEARLAAPYISPPSPTGRMAFDAAGNLYFADTGNHCIRRIDTSGIITTVAGNGGAGFAGDGGPALDAQLDAPVDIEIAGDGTIYVADTRNSCVRAFTPGGSIRTVAGQCGQQGFDGDGGPARDALLDKPSGIELDSDGNLYIADTNNHRIRFVPR